MEKQKPQRILLVHNYYQIPGGEDTVVANEKRMLEQHGHKVILYSRANAELNRFSWFRKLMLPVTAIFNIRTYREIKALIRRESIDIVHVHNTLTLISPSVYYAARKMRVPVVQTIHNFRMLCPGATFYRDGSICEDCTKYGLRCAIRHRCYRGSRLQTMLCVVNTKIHRMTGIYGKINYICLTEFNKNKLLELPQIRPERVFVKPNFVEHGGTIIPARERKNQFVYAGRLDRLKGIDILFEAWKAMGERALKLIVCGTGPLEEWCKAFVEDNSVNIELRGYIANEKALELIANSRALILPTQWYEGFPMTIVEAFSMGTPVICSNLGNAGSIVEEGVTGYKFKADDLYALIAAVDRTSPIYDSTFARYQCNYDERKNYSMLTEIYQIVGL